MSEDWAEDLARLHDEVDKSAQRFADANAHIEPVTASDSTGAVTVTLDKAGVLQDVRVDAAWRKSLEPPMLGAAVQEATSTAAAQRTEAWSTRFAEQSNEPDPPVRPMPPSSESVAGQLAAMSDETGAGAHTAALEELLAMVKAVNSGIEQATSEVGAYLAAEYPGRSSSGHVRASVLGSGTIKELTYDKRWIEKAHHFNVGRETTEAIRDAHQKMANRSVPGIIDASPLGQVLALANDPMALAERLRLRS
jgi:DNA-binding protein YbaB